MPRPLSYLSDTTIDTPPLSPSSATRSSVASSNSSLSLGELSSRMSSMRIGSQVAHEPTECVNLEGSSRKFAHDNVKFGGARDGDILEELDADAERATRSFDRGRTGHELQRDHPERTSRPRPQMPRQGSYSKRHSSFDTPREVPFPYGYLAHSDAGAALPDHSADALHERPHSVPLSPPGKSGRRSEAMGTSENHSLALTESEDGSANGGSTPPRNFERSSTSSLPLPTFTPYSALPPISSTSPPRSDCARTPPVIPPSTLAPTGFPSPLISPPRTTSLNPPVTKLEPPQLPPPARPTQLPRAPDSPPFVVDEPDANEVTRSTDSQSYFLPPAAAQDVRPHYSLPPPPKFLSSLSFTSPPAFRPMSLPQPIENPTPASQPPSTSPFPPPEPPTILTPPPPLSDAEAKARTPAPYEPFLPRDQPPPDHTYIAVETVAGEYRLIVRLPGFQRDSITLAMRRRRILHVVADNWSDGGGHFERRISFGYDADLASVRAEFDGEILRVIVPRREPPGWFTQQTN